MDAETPVRGEHTNNDEREEQADFDLRRVGVVLRRRVRLMLVVFAAVVVAAAAITLLMPPIYQAEVTLMVQKTDAGAAASVLGDIPLIGGALAPRGSKTQELLLEHPDLTEKAAKELGLLKETQSIDELEYTVQADSDSESDLVVLKVEGKDPGKAADLAKRITDLFLKQSRELAQESPKQAAADMRGELRDMETALAESEEKLRKYQAAHGIADIGASITASIERAAALGAQSDTASSTRAGAQSAADYFRRKLAREHSTYIASSTIARNPVVQKLESDLSDVQLQRAAQAVAHGPQHPDVKKLDERIAEATAQLRDAMQTVIESQVKSSNPVYIELAQQLAVNEAETAKAAGEEAALATLSEREMAKMGEWPDMATQLGRLKRDQQVAADLYVMLMKNYQQMKINEAVASPGVTLVAEAKLPEKPVRPQKVLNMVLGFAVGLLLALLGAVLAEALDDRMRTEADVSRRLGLRVLGVLPAARDMAGYIVGSASDPELGERFRALRTSIRFAFGGASPPTLLVTSPGAGEGKTSVALGLGIALAQNGHRVVVVDADMRRSAARKGVVFSVDDEAVQGLSAVLAGLAEPMGLVRRTGIDRLSVLPAGEVPPNPVELLDSPRARETLELLRTHFDVVVVDSPPCPAFVETVLAATMCEASLLVLDATLTRAGD
ncbi:MAG: polysaccharide biosynthesis tyrosine autokinase, partial [Armatimonadetes bacterium]|nr:polysaccharide biosynthesis tyrosine autokinase [Armatimonadota bacterium]